MSPLSLKFRQVATDTETITKLCRQANSAEELYWHALSGCIRSHPQKMWLIGLRDLQKPLLHFHTQLNTEIPWNDIDMDYMNLHQSAHGGREFGFALSRLRQKRHVITGHWRSPEMQQEFVSWALVALGWAESQITRVARFGDNMRDVAVTEGDKVEAQIKLGWRVDGYSLEDLYRAMDEAKACGSVEKIIEECFDLYEVAPSLQRNGERHRSLIESAEIEAGLRFISGTRRFYGIHYDF